MANCGAPNRSARAAGPRHRNCFFDSCLRFVGKRQSLISFMTEPTATPHLPRLGLALRELLQRRRHGALGTLDAADGSPFVSMVPYAIDRAAGRLVLHVSGLAAHTANMAAEPRVSLMVTEADADDAPVHDLPRATLQAIAHTPEPGSPAWQSARNAYLQRFADAQPMTELPDFRFVTLAPTGARQIAGFGSARSVQADELLALLQGA